MIEIKCRKCGCLIETKESLGIDDGVGGGGYIYGTIEMDPWCPECDAKEAKPSVDAVKNRELLDEIRRFSQALNTSISAIADVPEETRDDHAQAMEAIADAISQRLHVFRNNMNIDNGAIADLT